MSEDVKAALRYLGALLVEVCCFILACYVLGLLQRG